MKQLDLTETLEKRKGSKVTYCNVYLNPPYYGFADSGEMPTGISFVRTTKKGVKTDRSGRIKWYFGSSTDLSKAITKTRKRYGLKLKHSGWCKVKVKAYNFTNTDEILSNLKTVL